MGNMCSSEAAEILSKAIDRQLAHEASKAMERKKLLLLGAGECGKSTILKQVRILHDDSWSDVNKDMEKVRIYSNIIEGMYQLCAGVELLGMLMSQETEGHYAYIRTIIAVKKHSTPITVDTKRVLKTLWADPVIQKAYELRSELQVADSIKHFLDSLDRITDSDYKPSNEDYLNLRIPTTAISENRITINKNEFVFIDVGGQRSQRKKWISHFESVNAIIFISAISEFDQKMQESSDTNRLIDSMALYQAIINNSYFEKTAMILFLNKTDLFMEKIKRRGIDYLFKKYKGPNTYKESIKYIEDRFRDYSEKVPYVHYTCATDTNQVELVIKSVVDSILKSTLAIMGVQ